MVAASRLIMFFKRRKFQQFFCPGLVRGKAVKDQLHDVQAVKDELFYGWFPDQSFQICRDFTDSRGWQTVGWELPVAYLD